MLHPREYRFRVDPKTAHVVGQSKTVAELRDLFLQLNSHPGQNDQPKQDIKQP